MKNSPHSPLGCGLSLEFFDHLLLLLFSSWFNFLPVLWNLPLKMHWQMSTELDADAIMLRKSAHLKRDNKLDTTEKWHCRRLTFLISMLCLFDIFSSSLASSSSFSCCILSSFFASSSSFAALRFSLFMLSMLVSSSANKLTVVSKCSSHRKLRVIHATM